MRRYSWQETEDFIHAVDDLIADTRAMLAHLRAGKAAAQMAGKPLPRTLDFVAACKWRKPSAQIISLAEERARRGR